VCTFCHLCHGELFGCIPFDWINDRCYYGIILVGMTTRQFE
jgi:hypothetical protein